ncbi:pleckstrin homology domain-containing family A member 7 isoform X6 [Entelurus aequoreus]|uniref:pleckstrin homology domain-containing family A member 7 isoform X6 n=1 Tax=Entelurus aequoreus TaxID=161455 RepID=UPI002B1D066C|nr:pleckstrin homology domain-containing family A member 7 isoform X6 [Entelurus aequoreus]
MAAPLGRDTLPDHWSYGVCRDGRVFFINDKTRGTTWLHPRTGEPVNSGHMIRSDLPRGWEEGFTDEGASYFINHNVRCTSFRHPGTGQISPENTEYTLEDKRIESYMFNHRHPSMVTESTKAVTTGAMEATSGSKGSRGSSKCHSFGKRDQAIKRNLNIPVVVRGWLYKQDSTGMRLWKRKWFVLSDFCLFYYKDSREETVLGSIPLPSYLISQVAPEDHINRKYAFKAEHSGMRTYFFSADTQEDMNGWIRAMNQAALMQQTHTIKREKQRPDKNPHQAPLQTNHVNHSISQTEAFLRTDCEHSRDDGIRLAPADEGRYVLEVQGRRRLSDPRERLSPNLVDAAAQRNSHQSAQPSEQNGNLKYQRGCDTEKHAQRKNTLAQVEHWVKVQKGDPPKSAPSAEFNLPRQTPPLKVKVSTADTSCQSLPKSPRLPSGSNSPSATFNLPSDYKYAHDRLSHFRMSTDERMATKEGMVWQLYEWQQRQQFRHGSPTAPLYTGPNFTDSSSFTVTVEMPRSISVPPSPCEVPPSVSPSFKPLSPRRPHTPSGRRTVMPLDDLSSVDTTGASSPGLICTRLSQMERRSMPSMGYITHTVSAPSLHGKTADDTCMQLKKDLEYLDLKVTGRESLRKEAQRPVKIAESDADVKLSRLCEQDKILQELEARIRTLKEDKDKLESVLDVSHRQMEQYIAQPAHVEKIAYQQKLLQEDVVHIRAEISEVSTEMENAWNEYMRLERDVDWHKTALQGQMTRSDLCQQERVQMRKELWRIEDVIAGLSSSKANYKVTISSVTNPERKFVPSVSASSMPSVAGSPSAMEMQLSQQHSPHLSPSSHNATTTPMLPSSHQPSHHNTTSTTTLKWAEEDVPPRPPLPQVYSPDEHPPAVPPLPRETTVIRHTSVRGLKRQSDERKRDREIGQYTNGDIKVELRPFLSDPELVGVGDGSSSVTALGHEGGYQTLPSRGVTGSTLRLNQSSSISSYVTLRRATSAPGVKERSKSALERLYSTEAAPQRGRMSADEQLERMKRHQKALLRQRKRTLSHGDRHASPSSRSSSSAWTRPLSADFGSWRREQEFDLQLLERAVQGEEAQGVRSVQGEERPPEHKEKPRSHSDEWLTFHSMTMTTPTTNDAEPEILDYDKDLLKELSMPQKVVIPERYMDLEQEEPLSPQEMEDRHRKVERIKNILAKSSIQNLAPPPLPADKSEVSLLALDSVLQEQERIITMSYMLASEASLKSKRVAAQAISGH